MNEQSKQALKETLGLFAGFIAVVVGVLQIADPNAGTGWLWTALIVAVGGFLAALHFRSLDARHRGYANAAVAVCLIGGMVCGSGLLGFRVSRTSSQVSVAGPTSSTHSEVSSPAPSPAESGIGSGAAESPVTTESGAAQSPVAATITSPASGGSVKACSYFSGTWSPQAGRTLILAARNEAAPQKYVEYVFGWRDPTGLAQWRAAQYFNEKAVGQNLIITLESVSIEAAQAAYDAGADASNQLTSTSTVLATVRVKRVAGGSGDDCPGP